jgi:hypothetical protein
MKILFELDFKGNHHIFGDNDQVFMFARNGGLEDYESFLDSHDCFTSRSSSEWLKYMFDLEARDANS